MREPGGDGTAEPGDLAGEAAAPTAFKPLATPAGAWPAVWRPPRQQPADRFSRWRTLSAYDLGCRMAYDLM